jgi:uncharacterized repeat protein (TIGR01451 family)
MPRPVEPIARALASPSLLTPAAPNITATKTDSPGTPANPGDTITYTVMISNTTGTADATGVMFNDTIDANTTFVNGSINISPIAVNDTYNTIGNVNISVPAGTGLLANDLNPGGMGTLTITAFDATSVHGGTVTVNTTDGSFTYNPAAGFSGPTDTFTYTLGNGTGLTDTATVTINISGLIWFVDNSPGANGDGRLSSPFRTFVGGANPLTGTVANDAIFIYTGSGNYTGGLTLTSGEKLIGQGASQSILTITGFSTPSGTNLLPSTGGSNPTITAASANEITLGSNNQIWGTTFGSTTGTSITGSAYGTLKVRDTTITNGSGRALNLSNGTMDVILQSLSSTNSSTTGTTIDTSAGSFSVTGTTSVTSSSSDAVSLTTNTGTLTFAALNITNTTHNGLIATNNSNTITTTSGAISTTTGTAVQITRSSSTTPLAVSLTSVSANGGTNGIFLSNTSGSFTVNGDGTSNKNGSGGTIQSLTGGDASPVETATVGVGVYMSNVSNVSLNRMNLHDFSNYGIIGTNVTGFTLTFSVMNGTNGTNHGGVGEGTVYFTGLSGSATVTSCDFSGGAVDTFHVFNNGAQSLNRITITSCSFAMTDTTGGDAIGFQATGGTFNATIQSSTITSARSDQFQLNLLGTVTSDLVFGGATNVLGNTLTNNNSNIVSGGGGVTIGGGGPSNNITLTYNISHNSMKGSHGAALAVSKGTGTGASLIGTIDSNVIGTSGTSGSGSTQGEGIALFHDGAGSSNTTITNNQVFGVVGSRGAIDVFIHNGAAGTMKATVQSNTIGTLDQANSFAGMYIQTGSNTVSSGSPDNNNSCMTIGGAGSLKNSIDVGANTAGNIAAGITVEQEGDSKVALPGYAGTAYDSNAVQTFVGGNNTVTGSNAQAVLALHDSSSPAGFGYSGNCAAIGISSVRVGEMSASSATQSDSSQSQRLGNGDILQTARGFGHEDNPQKVTQRDLLWLSQGALQRWREAGISEEDLARLQTVDFELVILPEGQIASVDSTHIKIDETGAGYGWFFDQTPNEDSEFDVPVPGRELQATEYSPAYGKMDLLTVVMRELGTVYVQGKKKMPKQLRPLMQGTLSPSVRRLPDPAQAQMPSPQSEVQSAPQTATSAPVASSTGGGRNTAHTSSAVSVQSTSFPLSLGTIPMGEKVTITFQVTINAKNALPAGLTQVCNQGTVTGSNFTLVNGVSTTPNTDDPSVGGATDPTCTQLVRADLSMTKSAGGSSACSTSNITYTIGYNNAGPSAAANVVVSDTMPAGTSLVSVTTPATWSRTDAVPNGGNGTITFSKASSANADTASFTVVVSIDGTVADGAVLSNTASVTTDTYDPNLTNNTSSPATTVTVKKPPTTATVGGPQTICALGTTASLGGNTPTVGTGTWTVQSGGTGTFNPNATTPGATFTHATGTGPVVVRWTISNPPCTDSFAEVTVTIKAQPTATVGGPQTICALGTTASLGGNAPSGGATGMWSIVTGGVTGTFNPNATTPGATFTHTAGAVGSTATLRWTVSNAPCTDATADVVITIKTQPTASAGGPQTICSGGTTTSLGGNTPAGGATGTWSIVTAGITGTFNPNATTPGATFTHATGATSPFTLRWTVSNAPCSDATADVSITLLPAPTSSNGGAQTVCENGTTAGLGGNSPAGGETGTWSIVTGGATGTFAPNATTPNATFSPTSGPGTITLRWTVTNTTCGASATSDAVITVKQQPTATVGGPQTICALGTTASLGGNTPSGGATGMWSIVTGGATGTFNPNATTPGATFTHATGTGMITLRWTVSNAPCTSATADVVITINQPPTTASVGGPQTICNGSTTASLGGNTPTSGTGMWSIQTGGATGTFNPNASTPGATFTPTSGAGTIVVRWTISNPPCPDSFAEVTITVKLQPTATVGGPQTICAGGTTGSLGGNTPAGGATGTWSIVTAGATGTFNPNANTPGATFTHSTGTGTITLRWTVSNPPCADATADVAITINQSPTTATVGGPQTICALGTTAGLGGNTPTSGTGTWTVQSGGTGTFNPNANTPGATFTHTSGVGPIKLRWTISNPPCTDSFAEVTITINQPPTTATVGGPQTICDGSTTAGLGGDTPTSGTGTWSIQSGGTGTFTPNASTPNATFTPTGGPGTYTVRWTISDPPCPDSFAEVTVTVKQQPTATTGGPQTICAGSTSASLGGNTPAGGATGTWSIVTAGATGTFNPNANTPGATFTHTGGTGTITLRWTVTNPPCANATADVVLTIKQPPTTATVGGNQTISPGGTTAPLGGNTPASGTGTWTIATAGFTGTFNPNASTPNATWTHVSGSGQVKLRWTISNPPCPDSFAEVTVQIGVAPTITCPASPIVVNNDPGQCSASVMFTVGSTGIPAPTVVCKVGATVITSPHTFPVGTTTVNCTASNGVTPDASCSFMVTVNDTQAPVFPNGCPAPITATAQPSCPLPTSTLVNFAKPSATDNCGTPMVVCSPDSGTVFPVGITTVTCTATDTANNTAQCSFTVTVFSFCLQDDSSPGNVVLVNAQTGEFSFCCGGVPIASGRGDLNTNGCIGSINSNKGNRHVHIQWDTAAANGLGTGTAFVAKLSSNNLVCQITDRNMTNNTCQCPPPPPPPQSIPREKPDPGKRINGN